jgi:hypothetical protein
MTPTNHIPKLPLPNGWPAISIALLPKLARIPWARVRFHYDAQQDRMIDAEDRQMPFIHWAAVITSTLSVRRFF